MPRGTAGTRCRLAKGASRIVPIIGLELPSANNTQTSTPMSAYLAEFIGTFLLITVGASINANVVLAKTKGHNSGWTVITIGWGIGVFLGVYTATSLGGS